MLANSAALFGQIFTAMSRPEGLPAVIHCAGGKDRTGMAAALLLSLLAVDRDTVLDDYELSGTWRTVEHEQALVEVLMAAGIDYDVIVGFLGSPRWAMADALTALDLQHGGIETYLLGAGGMINSDLAKLRIALTTN